MDGARRWWRTPGTLRRFVGDLLAGELTRQRHAEVPAPSTWHDALAFDADLGVDSLEMLALGAALTEALQLHASGVEDYLLTRRTLGGWLEVASAGLELQSDRLTFRTSGSTGTAKSCEHQLADLLQEVDVLAGLLPGRRRVLIAVPCHHIYGFLFAVLLPSRLGVAGPDVIDLRPHSPGWLASHAAPGDLVIGHPEYWRAVERCGATLPADVVGVTSTAPCPDDVAQALDARGLGRLVQVYGASETAGIGWRDRPGVPYLLMPHWQLEGEGTYLERAQPGGGTRTVEAPDLLRPAGRHHVVIGDRRDGAVQVGGINVFPARVRAVLCQHPGVADAAVRLMAPHEGTRLKAFVVPRDADVEAVALAAELRLWGATVLAVPERPNAIAIGPALPRGPTGKLADWPARSGASMSTSEG